MNVPPPTIRIADASEAGRTCAYCRFPVKVDDELAVCTACSTSHHFECWMDNGGCAVVGCAAVPAPPGVHTHVGGAPTGPMTAQYTVPHAPPQPRPYQPPPPPSYQYQPQPPPPGGPRGLSPLVAGLIALVIIGATVGGVLAMSGGGGSDGGTDTSTVVSSSGSEGELTDGTAESEPVEETGTQDTGVDDTGTGDTGTGDTGTGDTGTGDTGSGDAGTGDTGADEAPDEPNPPPTASAASGSGPASMLDGHFADIRDGKFSRAYSKLVFGEVTESSESSWIADKRDNDLYDYDLEVDTQFLGDGKAIANVVTFRTKARRDGCSEFTGRWRVRDDGSGWRITKSELQPRPCG